MPRRPLRIALAAIEYPPDTLSSGIGAYTRALATGLVERGHSVHVVTRSTDVDRVDDEDGVIVHRLTPLRPKLPDALTGPALLRFGAGGLVKELRYRQKVAARLETLVRSGEIELIEAADHLAEPIFYRPWRHPEVPFIVRLHTPLAYSELLERNIPEPLRRLVRAVERRMLLKASRLSAPGQVCADAFRQEMRLGDRPITVFPNPPTYPLELRATPVQEDPNLVLYAGRITRWKGVDLLIRAVPHILDKVPSARFLFVGSDNVPTGGFPNFTSYAMSLLPPSLHRHVLFTGYLSPERLAGYYRQAAVCVFPSVFEAFGYTCLEAMTHSKAVVGSARGGMVEMLGGGAGRLYTPPDVAELAGHIAELLLDPGLRRKLGEAARRRVLANYQPDTVLDTIETYYRRVLEAAGARAARHVI